MVRRGKAATRLVGAFAVGLYACSGEPPSPDPTSDEGAIYADTNALWSTPTSIPVCWEAGDDVADGGDANERSWVRSAIQGSWEAATANVRFVGWGSCDAKSRGLRIAVRDTGPHTKGLGSRLDGVRQGMVLNFTFENWSPSCRDAKIRERCIRSIAVHEFGHALGLAHEQNRADTPSTCSQAPQGSNGNMRYGAWDVMSVMSYCRPDYHGPLTETDKEGIRLLYPSPNGGGPAADAGFEPDPGR